MDKEQHQEWQKLEQEAIELVRGGLTRNEVPALKLLQLLVIPSFEPTIGVEIFRKTSRSKIVSYVAAQTVWRRDWDIEKFRTPVERLKYPRSIAPTIHRKIGEVSNEIIEGWLNQLKSISIPAWVENESIDLDRTRYELSLGQDTSFLSVRYAWWEQPPEAWQPLARVTTEIFTQLNSWFDGKNY
jgi:hypothetical protein